MTGARIMSGDQMDEIRDWHDSWAEDMDELGDDDSDPPRIWLPDDCCPGCAFSRSLGDRVAKEIGVIALPELLDKQITENDEYVVLCSDGVFEFISNQMAMDIVAQCGDPVPACYALVQEAYKLWLQIINHDRRQIQYWVQRIAQNCARRHLLLRRALEPLHRLLEAVELGELGAARPGALGGGGGRHQRAVCSGA